MFGISSWRGAGSKVRLRKIVWVCVMSNLQITFHEFVNLHDSSFITASVAIIWGGKDSDYIALVCPVVSVHDQLMGSCNPCEVVWVVELLWNVLAERVTSTSRTDTPTTSVIRIGPEKIADWPKLNEVRVWILESEKKLTLREESPRLYQAI